MQRTLASPAYLQGRLGTHPQEEDHRGGRGRSQRASCSLPASSLSIVKVRCPKKATH